MSVPGAAALLADALARQARGELGPAERLGRAVLALEPGNVGALELLGLVLRQRGELAEAASLLRRAAVLRPGDPDLLNNLASTLAPLGETDEAIDCFRAAIAGRPGDGGLLSNLAHALAGAGRTGEAEITFRAALRCDPGLAAAHHGLARVLAAKERHAEEVGHLRSVLAMRPDDGDAARGLASALLALGRFEEARAVLEPLSARTGLVRDIVDLGAALHQIGRFAAARAIYDRALALEPDRPQTRFNRALLLLALGEFRAGLAEHEQRLRIKEHPMPVIAAPFWRGEGLAGRSIRVFPEQGLGDLIQFIRFLPRLAAAGAAIRLDVPDIMLRFMAPFGGAALRLAPGESTDFKVSAMSLAHRFRVAEAELAAGVPYFRAEPALVERWRQRIGEGGLRVGICWQGNPVVRWDDTRSIPLARFLPLARIPGIRLISLQQNHGLDQLEAAPAGAVETLWDRFPGEPDALVDTAAVMACLDLVVTSDTSVAHLAGALGRPVFLALRHVPDWRWMLDRADSPWYPSMRLFRQPRPGAWAPVFAAIAAAIAAMLRAPPPPASPRARAAADAARPARSPRGRASGLPPADGKPRGKRNARG